MIESAAAAEPPPGPVEESAPAPRAVERPAYIPEKFWDADQGCARVEALAKSYGELERKLGSRPHPVPAGEPAAAPAGEPEAPGAGATDPGAGYSIEARHPLVAQDPALDARLQAAGFSQAQAQLVYDLAAERLVPLIDDAMGEIEAQRQVERLERQFGGAEAWRETARQIKSWSAAHLPGDAAATLSGSYEGILALHRMMQASEPELLGGGEEAAAPLSEDALALMMRDPRYWRRRDPDFVARVTAGFQKLYGP